MSLFGKKVYTEEVETSYDFHGIKRLSMSWDIWHDARRPGKPLEGRTNQHVFAIFRGGCGIGIGGKTLKAAKKEMRRDMLEYVASELSKCHLKLGLLCQSQAVIVERNVLDGLK
jgi:hypothetical protein